MFQSDMVQGSIGDEVVARFERAAYPKERLSRPVRVAKLQVLLVVIEERDQSI